VGEVRPSNLKLRSGMLPGDVLAVTGALGASRAGLAAAVERPELGNDPAADDALRAFRTPEPRLAEGRWLGASRNVRAMMDTSDGLSSDLARLARASGTGAVIEAVPVAACAAALAERAHADAAAWALDGGEDFELLVAVAPRAFSHLAARFHARFGRPLLRVGTATAELDGTAVGSAGWDHLRA
jgi:thiamine-monophosphate kinase